MTNVTTHIDSSLLLQNQDSTTIGIKLEQLLSLKYARTGCDEQLRVALDNLISSQDGILRSVEFMSKACRHEATPEAIISTIQFQAVLRMQLWSTYGDTFAEVYMNRFCPSLPRKNRKRKRSTVSISRKPVDVLFHDITSILSMAAFRIPHDKTFASFLTECIAMAISSTSKVSQLPTNTVERLFDSFELKGSNLKTEDSPPKPFLKRRQADNPTTSTIEDHDADTKEIRINNNLESILPTSIQLTVPVSKSNSLLLRDGCLARSRFVGSHFNTNKNLTSLFRPVKVPPQTMNLVPKKPRIPERRAHLPMLTLSPCKSIQDSIVNRGTATSRLVSVGSWTPNKSITRVKPYIVQETPCAKKYRSSLEY